ncbi:MAG: class I SAM-dependent methyltransferase [Nitrospirota bacterium]|nr:MAG: class I SAM-dependent methyltransferase [Nitrospirota bacterium]
MLKSASTFAKALILLSLVCSHLGPMFSPFPAEGSPRDKDRWNQKYQTQEYISGKEPIPFLKQNIDMLPKGTALDVAMGEGRNGVYLARKGFEVTGIDISETGLRKAEALAAEHGVAITTKVADLEEYKLAPNTYDVIICTYYLQRDLFPQIISALKPGGMAVVETFTMDHKKYQPGFRQEYLLKPNELLTLFKGLTVIRYQAVDNGEAAYASILVQNPS